MMRPVALMQKHRWLFLLWVALNIIILDQLTKAIVVANLVPGEKWMPIEAIQPYFTITYITNTGAAFGLFQDGGTFFILITFVVIGIIIYFYREMPPDAWLLRAALGLQLGGALGNLIDRLRQGYVVDFFDFQFFPIFNVADSSISIGVALLILLMWREDRRQARLQAEAQTQEASATDTHAPPPEDEPSSLTPG